MEQAKILARPRQRDSLWAWSLYHLRHAFPGQPSTFHQTLATELEQTLSARQSRRNYLAPRGNAKSTWGSFAFPIYAAVHGLEPYIILTSDTGEQAHKYLDSIRAELEGNDLLQESHPEVFGEGPVWREDRIRLANGVLIEAFGTGTKLRGRKNRQHRPTLIVVDDPQNTEHILSKLQRRRSWDWLMKDVCNAGSPTTNIIVLGTSLHRECIVERLRTTPGWITRVWRSIDKDAEDAWPWEQPLWIEWERIYSDPENPNAAEDAREFYEANKERMSTEL